LVTGVSCTATIARIEAVEKRAKLRYRGAREENYKTYLNTPGLRCESGIVPALFRSEHLSRPHRDDTFLVERGELDIQVG